MNIALITDGIAPYVIGGMQRHSFYLAKYFAKQKINVDLFHFNQSNLDIKVLDCFSEEEKAYIKSYVINFPNKGHFFGHYIYESYIYSRNIYEVIKPNLDKYDFIYTKGFSGWYLISKKKKGLKCPPIGINVHGYEMFQSPPSVKQFLALFLLRLFIKPLIIKSDKVFSYGGKITTLLNKTVKIPAHKILEIPGGIENTWINENPKNNNEKVKFVFIGRNERRKGILELNRALNNLKELNNIEFVFIGPIPEYAQLPQDNIKYLGEVRDVAIIKKILFESDVLVCSSHSEGMPNVILEAMANQLAIIATDVGAVNMMVDSSNGWLLNEVSVKNIEKAIQSAATLNRLDLRNKQLESLKKVKARFLWEKLILSLIAKI